MIIVRIAGGLGNQLFQYALGRALSLKNKDSLKFDIRSFEGQTNDRWSVRKFELNNFNTVGEIATPDECRKLQNPYGILSKYIRAFRIRILRQSYIRFFPRILRKKGDVYLEGYWQSERYFKEYEAIIRNDLTPKHPLGSEAQKILSQILQGSTSVSLHIRRGDNAYNPSSMKAFGMPASEYYPKALEEIAKKIGRRDIHVYIFSDEPEWVCAHMSFPFPVTYVSRRGIADWEEIMLMKECRHHVISNSTFSWWGAWLNPRPDKIVIAPTHWANARPNDFRDIIPDGWTRI